MPSFEDHIVQSKRNLRFLESVNSKLDDYVDWQVTTCFYVALHLVNAHLAKSGLQYRSHNEVNNAINPENRLSVTKLPEDEYISYRSLQNLSRRARYLVNHNDGKITSNEVFLTYDKHLSKSLRHLDNLLKYFGGLYKISFESIQVKCPSLSNSGDMNHIVKSP